MHIKIKNMMPLSIIHFTIDSWLPLRQQISSAQWSCSSKQISGSIPVTSELLSPLLGLMVGLVEPEANVEREKF